MVIKNNFPEFSDEWVFQPNKNIPLKNQIICTSGNNLLLNVRKIYTNNIYFGVIWTSINNLGEICHPFRCKDRGFTEDLVDNKQAFINVFIDTLSLATTRVFERSETKTIKSDFLQEYDVTFVLDSNNKYFATTAIINNTAPIRGLYGAKTEEEHTENIKDFGVSVLNRFPTEEEVKHYIIDKQNNALSANNETRVNTEYSQIKIYHKSEIQWHVNQHNNL